MNAWTALRLAVAAGAMTLTAAAEERLDFRTRILPILTKAGCNSGQCHGAAVGQGGFKLSLLGYDPVQDYLNITRERGGRRMDAESPARSLLLRKATDQLDHDGGRRIKPDSEAYRTLVKWLGAGAAFGPPDLRVTAIEVEPPDLLLPSPGQTAQLRVTARLSDATQEDVSALALYSTNDDAVAEVKSSGLVTVRDCGSTSIMVRYAGQVVAARVAVPFGEDELKVDFVPRNFIDEAVLAELRRLRLPPSPLSDDAEFLRRVFLDLIGRLPTAAEARAFLREPPSDGKRSRLIAALTEREEFVDFWTMKFGDWLLIGGKRGGELPTRTYHAWVRKELAQRRPLDQMVRDLLLAQGDPAKVGPANFYTLASDPRDLGEYVGSMFLGTQIACARCHAHPADRWTQDDYHAFAAYFARITQKDGRVTIAERGEVEHPKTHQPMTARPLGGAPGPPDAHDPRAPLAEWLVAGDNPLFARNLVNRVWKHLLGRGLVEPVDDLRPTNPPANPALLDALAASFVQHGFDLRRLVREIAGSRTYQLASLPTPANRRDERLFSHAYLKPLPAQVLADAVAQVTGVPDTFPGTPAGTRAVQLIGAQTPSPALDVLGRCPRERTCETAARPGGGLAQALHLINGSTINGKLREAVQTLQSRHLTGPALLDELYLRALSRPPTAAERTAWEPQLATDAEAVEDLLWALLNSREFSLNH
ncbi:MAG TPA: DUF1553 domain-containing protein [Chthoniobacteraceae bacterium]|jgi:hypothetical protein|nr:DUF1553 domain-containing protein [Chthoniobacteraceae bacterium]